MNKNYFEIVRPGINTTFQDSGRENLYHIGIPFSGAMDNRNYLLANSITGNPKNFPVIEFAYQGPLLKFNGKKINFNSIRKGEVVGEHEVIFSSGKEIVRLNHESFDRALYSEGALTAARWLLNKKPGLYSMRDLLNFK